MFGLYSSNWFTPGPTRPKLKLNFPVKIKHLNPRFFIFDFALIDHGVLENRLTFYILFAILMNIRSKYAHTFTFLSNSHKLKLSLKIQYSCSSLVFLKYISNESNVLHKGSFLPLSENI